MRADLAESVAVKDGARGFWQGAAIPKRAAAFGTRTTVTGNTPVRHPPFQNGKKMLMANDDATPTMMFIGTPIFRKSVNL